MTDEGGLSNALKDGRNFLSDSRRLHFVYYSPKFASGGEQHCVDTLRRSAEVANWVVVDWKTSQSTSVLQLKDTLIEVGKELSPWLWVRDLLRRVVNNVARVTLPVPLTHDKLWGFSLPVSGYQPISEIRDLGKRLRETARAARSAGKEGMLVTSPNIHEFENKESRLVFDMITASSDEQFPVKLVATSSVEGLEYLRNLGAECHQVKPFSFSELRGALRELLAGRLRISDSNFRSIAEMSGGRLNIAAQIVKQSRAAALDAYHQYQQLI